MLKRFCQVWAVCAVLALLMVAIGSAQHRPTLTDLERAKFELLTVRISYAKLLASYDGCKAEVGQAFDALGKLRAAAASAELTADEQTLTAAIDAAHPGYVWDPRTATFAPAPPKKPPEKP